MALRDTKTFHILSEKKIEINRPPRFRSSALSMMNENNLHFQYFLFLSVTFFIICLIQAFDGSPKAYIATQGKLLVSSLVSLAWCDQLEFINVCDHM